MGSYNVTCGVSHASIGGGDEALIVVLLPSSEERRNDPFDNMPYGVFPIVIRGEYNDYGGLCNIQPTPGTKLLEEAFEVSIEAFVECLTDIRGGDPLSDWAQFMRPEFIEYYRTFKGSISEGLMVVGFSEVEPTTILPTLESSHGDSWWVHSDVPSVVVKLGSYTKSDYNLETWKAYEISEDFVGKKGLRDLVIGWRSSHLFNLLDCIYQGTGVHLAYPLEFQKKTFFHRMKDLTYLWVHKEVFEAFSKPMKDEYGILRKHWWEEESPSSKYLELLGFVKDEKATTARRAQSAEDGQPHRYYQVYKHKTSEKYAVFSDGRFSCVDELSSNKRWPEHSVYRVSDLIKIWKKLTKAVLEVPEDYYGLCPNTMEFRELSESLLEFNKNPVEYKEKWWHDPLNKHHSHRFSILCFENEWTEWNFIKELFEPGILDKSLENEMVRMAYFIQNLRKIAFPLRPMPYYGPQCGNFYVLKEFGAVIKKIAIDNTRREYD